MNEVHTAGNARSSQHGKKTWTPPALEELPPLTELTLATGAPIGGGTGIFG